LTSAVQPPQVTPPSTFGQSLKGLQQAPPATGGAGAGAGAGLPEAGAGVGAWAAGEGAGAPHWPLGLLHLHSMSDVKVSGKLHGTLCFTSQFSALSSAAATQTWPKLSQYLSQRPP